MGAVSISVPLDSTTSDDLERFKNLILAFGEVPVKIVLEKLLARLE